LIRTISVRTLRLWTCGRCASHTDQRHVQRWRVAHSADLRPHAHSTLLSLIKIQNHYLTPQVSHSKFESKVSQHERFGGRENFVRHTYGMGIDLGKVMEKNDIVALAKEFSTALASVGTSEQLEKLRLNYSGKKGVIKDLLEQLKISPIDERKTIALKINEFKKYIEESIAVAQNTIRHKETDRKIQSEWLDISLPSTNLERGALHPLSIIERKCLDVLNLLGLQFVEGPEVETPFHNFDALNIPEHHPARDMQDTFWLDKNLLLRSHTSTVQIRSLQNAQDLPIKVASPGRVYRNEEVDATHLACFHQFEGLWVDKGITFAHLKGTLEFIIQNIFGKKWDFRFKPKFYPYTEPSIGVDIRSKDGDGKWLTVLGAGMIHPNVFIKTGHDPESVSGFAFGLGISRMVAMSHHISNMKSLYEGDLRIHRSLARKDYI